MTPEQIQQIIIALIGILGGGGLVAGINYFSGRGKLAAEARSINITGEITLAQGYKQYAEDIRKQLDEFEKKYDKEMSKKDLEIKDLQKQILTLTAELKTYTNGS